MVLDPTSTYSQVTCPCRNINTMQTLPTTEETAGRAPRKGNRFPISCTECRKRKQKCNKATPCNHCSRRYPPPICRYEDIKSVGMHQGETGAVIRRDGGSSDPSQDYFLEEPYEYHQSLNAPEDQYAASRASPVPFHDRPSTQITKISSREEKSVGKHGRLRRQGKNRNFTTEEVQTSDYVRFCLNPYLLPRRNIRSAYGCPEAFDAPLPLVGPQLAPIPIPNKGRYAELFHFFHHVLAPYIGAIDGLDQSKLIRDVYRPWMTNSPFMAYTAILSSSGYQAEARGLDVSTHVETIAIKVEIIKIINEYLRTSRGMISDEAIAAVNHLLINEWYYGDKTSQLAHMRGLQQMLRLRGGLESMRNNTALYALVAITDYEIACTCERELSLHEDTGFEPLSILSSYQIALECPLLASNTRFVDICEDLGISSAAAKILDDMRFLTSSIVALSSSPYQPNSPEVIKTLTTARWIHDRVSALPSINNALDDSPLAGDHIYECIRLAATIYATSILHRTPLSKACTPLHQQMFWTHMPCIPLSRWKEISGIYLWLTLVFCPAAEWTRYGRFLKSMASTTMTYVGLESWEAMRGCVEALLGVQRWLRGDDGYGRGRGTEGC